MRKFVGMAGMIFLSWLFIASVVPLPKAVSQPYSSPPAQVLGDARLGLVQGDVVVQTEATGSEWGAAVINTPLVPGTKLWDPENGRSEIQFFGGSYLRSSANTEVDVTNLSLSTGGDVIQVGVPQGRVYVNYAGSRVQNSVFQVDTPVTSIMSYGPSRFEVDVYEDGYTEVSVLNGSVSVQGQNGISTVDAGTMLSMGPDQVAELSPMRPEDAWISWNLSRDSALAHRGPSRSYLPGSLSIYSNDFDSYGRWVDTPDYGYVWTPLSVAVDWAPYRIGRWCWIGGDYVWVSYEPWGWVPYHYGRWAFLHDRGWCWVPPRRTDTVYWSPGYVAWVQTPTYVSWVPLAPGEIYYGHGYYGPNSVNITNVNINRINVTNVYVNSRVTNAVTVVNRETFLTGRQVSVANVPANPFRTGVKVAVGGPDIKPVRATALPDPVKVVPQKVLPPKEVARKTVQVENRPAAVQKNVSVFKPGEGVAPMQVKKVEHPKPVAEVKKPETRQPSIQQKGEISKPPAQGAETSKPPVEQRQFGAAPPHQGGLGTPSSPREQGRPSAPNVATPQTQKPQSVAPNRERMNTPPPDRKQIGPPSTQGSLQRQMGSAPPVGGQSAGPPPRQEPMNRPPAPNMVTPPQAQRPQSVVPNKERANIPPNRREVTPPSAQGGGPSLQRQMGVAPQQRAQSVTPPATREPMGRPPAPNVVTPPQAQRPQSAAPNQERANIPPNRREVTPPSAQGGGPPLQRQMGVAPQQRAQSVTPPATREPMGRPSTPNVAAPQPQRPQSPTPNTGRMSTPPTRREVGPPPNQGGSSLQRQMGAAPPHAGGAVTPPAHPQGMPQPPVQSTTKQPAQKRELGR